MTWVDLILAAVPRLVDRFGPRRSRRFVRRVRGWVEEASGMPGGGQRRWDFVLDLIGRHEREVVAALRHRELRRLVELALGWVDEGQDEAAPEDARRRRELVELAAGALGGSASPEGAVDAAVETWGRLFDGPEDDEAAALAAVREAEVAG